jgi:hypothetical protein
VGYVQGQTDRQTEVCTMFGVVLKSIMRNDTAMDAVTVSNTERCRQVSLNTDSLLSEELYGTGTDATRWVTHNSLMACLQPRDVHML